MKKLLHFIFDPKNEKLVLLLLPALVILIASAVFVPQISDIISYVNSKNTISSETVQSNVTSTVYTSNTPAITPVVPTAIPTNTPVPTSSTDIQIHLTALSVERDMHIFVRDINENIISGTVFDIILQYPDGTTKTCQTLNDGSCYLTNLSSGNYSVNLCPKEGYSIGSTVTVHVNDAIVFQKIENIEEIVEIKEISEGLGEIKTNEEPIAQQETVIEYVTSESETAIQPNADNSQYILDSNGNITYQYEYHTDENGYLLNSSGESTDIIPNLENGVLVCGLRKNADTNTYETVSLFNSDNTPIAEFYIIGVPILKASDYHTGWQTEGDNLVYYINGTKVKGLKNIDGKLYYFDGNGVRAQSVGCDVSFYNGNIDWAAVKNSGIEYAIIRIGFRGWGSGAIYQDTCFEQNLRNAKNAGLKVGVYFYSSAVNKKEAVEEASICLDWMRGQSLDFPIFLDMEFSGDYPTGRADTLSVSSRVEIIQAFCETIKSGGYEPGIYCTQTFIRDEINYNLISQYYIWMASFTDNYVVPNVNFRYDMWQFTDFGKVTGINGAVDFDVIR